MDRQMDSWVSISTAAARRHCNESDKYFPNIWTCQISKLESETEFPQFQNSFYTLSCVLIFSVIVEVCSEN